MSDGQKPVLKIALVLKTDKSQKYYIASAWERDDGMLSAKWEKPYGDRPGIERIKLTDGTVLEAEDLFINIYDNRNDDRGGSRGNSRGGGGGGGRGERRGGREAPPPSTGGGGGQGGDSDDDIPF